jgi:hypothetical protein
MPQPPQLFSSWVVSKQAPPHVVRPPAHVEPQDPFEQLAVAHFGALHRLPQLPQLLVSLVVLTHEPLQRVSPGPQIGTQVPPVHVTLPPEGL